MTPPRTTAKDAYDPSNYERIRVHDIKARDKRYEVYYRGGTLYTTVNDKEIWADTPDELRDKIMKATKRGRVMVEVPFSVLRWVRKREFSREYVATVQNGIAVGLHQGHGAILVKWDDGKTEQFDKKFGRSRDEQTTVPLSKEEADEWIRLETTARAAQKAVDEWERSHSLDLRKLVEEAIEEKVGDGS